MRTSVFVLIFLGLASWGCHPKTEANEVTENVEKVSEDTTVSHTYDSYGVKVDSLDVSDHQVKRNESFYVILDKFDFNPREIYSITRRVENFVDLGNVRPGQTYRTYAASDSAAGIERLVWQNNPIDFVVFNWQNDSLEIYKAARPLINETVATSATIENSLYQTVTEQGVSRLLAYKMAEIFAWQINFFGLRDGDSFNVLYNKQFVDEDYYGIGEILAAEFTHRGESYRAYKFRDGYYTETGESVQKALLKAPFKFNQRVSSHFSHSRYHPILKKNMPHYGVDYAAPTGTPVLSVGDGTVTEAQYRGANGNLVKIKHNSSYRTAYLHLNGFADGIYRGAKVKQGQIIGYVGSTGRSTGPHLDYRLYHNDKPVNPLTVELPSSEAIPDSLVDAFEEMRDELDRKMEEQKSLEQPIPTVTQVTK